MLNPPVFGAPDPYMISLVANATNNFAMRNTSGKTLRNPRLDPGESTALFIIPGQSNCCNSVNATYTPTNADKIDNLNLYDGGLYAAKDPLLGCFNTPAAGSPWGNTFLRVADKLISDGKYDRVILAPIARGGVSITEWLPSTGPLYSRIIVAARRAAALGITVTAFPWVQGEADHAMTQADYQANLLSIIAAVRAAGYLAPWLIAKCTYINGSVDADIQAAQAAVVNGSYIFAGANMDSLTGTTTYRQADDTHFTAAGSAAAATLWSTAIQAAL